MQISVSIIFFQAISSLELILELSRDVVLKEYDQNTHLQNDVKNIVLRFRRNIEQFDTV